MQLKKNIAGADQLISKNNTSQFSSAAKSFRPDGVELTDPEKTYLLPHFLMLLVGKPGSGKTTMIKHLVMDKEFYRNKFDHVMLVSPSFNKIGLPINTQNMTSEFSLDWIYRNLEKVNKLQQAKLERIVSSNMWRNSLHPEESQQLLKAITEETKGQGGLTHMSNVLSTKASDIAMFAGTSQRGNDEYVQLNLKKGAYQNTFSTGKGKLGKTLSGETYMMQQISKAINQQGNNPNYTRKRSSKAMVKKSLLQQMPQGGYAENKKDENFMSQFIKNTANLDKKFISMMNQQQLVEQKTNVLIILDDVIGPIKALQNDPYLAQLIFNRRHLVANGTVSIILVTQKYTMIPARIRSNASWIILFRLNPLDFDNVFQDAFTGSLRRWKELLTFVFGDEDQNMIDMDKQRKNKNFDNLGIWVETDTYFSNFQQITLGSMSIKGDDYKRKLAPLVEEKIDPFDKTELKS